MLRLNKLGFILYATKKVGFDFDGVSTPENETDLYGIRYAEFVVPLVKECKNNRR